MCTALNIYIYTHININPIIIYMATILRWCLVGSLAGVVSTSKQSVVSTIFYVHPENWGSNTIWRAYFSKGLKLETTQNLVSFRYFLFFFGRNPNWNLNLSTRFLDFKAWWNRPFIQVKLLVDSKNCLKLPSVDVVIIKVVGKNHPTNLNRVNWIWPK